MTDHGIAALLPVLTVEHLMSVNMIADHGKAALPPAVATAAELLYTLNRMSGG